MKCPKCFKCQNFCWWDGDYVCMDKLSIVCPSKTGLLTDDVVNAARKNNMCSSFTKTSSFISKMLIEKFNSWNELHKLEKQLEMHVSRHTSPQAS